MEACTEERFLSDVKDHQMQKLLDSGVYRHIRFARTGSSIYHFSLVTWPGHLSISGDCGTYVFTRLNDMFEFFRMNDPGDFNYSEKRKLQINRGYWGEKVVAAGSRGDGVKSYSRERFNECIKDAFDSHFNGEDESPRKEAIWAEIEDQLIDRPDSEYEAHELANDFSCEGFQFQAFWERDVKEYTFSYLWCCYAIAYGIQQYDLDVAKAA